MAYRPRDMRRATTALLALVAGAALLAASCSGDDAGDDDATTSTTTGGGSSLSVEALDGRTFLSTSWEAPTPPVEGTRLRLSFDGADLSFQAGCNTYGGSYELDGDVLRTGPLGGTEIGCAPDLQAQDEALAALFQDGATLELDGAELTLASGATTIELLDEQEAVPGEPLVGTTWTVTTLITGTGPDGAASSVPAGAEPPALTIVDGAAGLTAEVFDGCNGGSGAVEVRDGTLAFGLMTTTYKGCPELEDLTTSIGAVIASGETAYELDGDTLTLTRGDRGLVLTAG